MVKAELQTSLLQLHDQEQMTLSKVHPHLQARYLSTHGCRRCLAEFLHLPPAQAGPDSSMMAKVYVMITGICRSLCAGPSAYGSSQQEGSSGSAGAE